MIDLKLVPVSKEHIDNICEIENESFCDPWNKQFFLELIDSPIAVCYAAVTKSGVSGYIITYHIADEIQILNIAVKRSERNKQIATNLFDVIFDYAEAGNAEKFTLEVRPSNTAAAALYKKLGFEIDGLRKNYYTRPKEDAILMSMKV